MALSPPFLLLDLMLAAPRITEDEWDERYIWLPNGDGDYELLSDGSPGVMALLAQHDRHFVWTQVDDPDGDGYLLVPGFWGGIGWYLCENPWTDEVIAVIE